MPARGPEKSGRPPAAENRLGRKSQVVRAARVCESPCEGRFFRAGKSDSEAAKGWRLRPDGESRGRSAGRFGRESLRRASDTSELSPADGCESRKNGRPVRGRPGPRLRPQRSRTGRRRPPEKMSVMDLFKVYPLWDIDIVRAEGSYVWDDKGTRYLDMYGGHAVISIGHTHPHYVEKVIDQLKHIGFYSNSVIIDQQRELASKLGELSGKRDYQLFLCNSGAEANENAMKLASFVTGKSKVIAMKGAFHGRTSLAVAATDDRWSVAPVRPDGPCRVRSAQRRGGARGRFRGRGRFVGDYREYSGRRRRSDGRRRVRSQDPLAVRPLRRSVHRRRGPVRLRT